MPTDPAEQYLQRLRELAYQRLIVARELEELDRRIAAYEAAREAAERTKRELDTQAAVDAATKESLNG